MSGKDRGRKPSAGNLSAEDKSLWEHVTRDAKALRRRRRSPAKTPAKSADEPPPVEKMPTKARRPARAAPVLPAAAKSKPPPPLTPGAMIDVDRRSAERLKRGQLPVEATLDLHGHRQAEAHGELQAFLASAHAAGRRCVLIITGKGSSQSGGGVLRTEVPKWLNEAPNRARIVAFAGARPQHGGSGALYVLVRRRRGEKK